LAVTLFAPTGIAHLSANMLQSLIDTANFDSLFKTRKFIFGVVLSYVDKITACYLIQIVGGGLAATAIHKGKSTAWYASLIIGTPYSRLCSTNSARLVLLRSWDDEGSQVLEVFAILTPWLLVKYRLPARS
ncbi:hypothetical protein H0H93_011024, partial [Arthromyces matolae]